jgi:hypothetical protein
MHVLDLCGECWCTKRAHVSYTLHGREVFLCKVHVEKLAKESGLGEEGIANALPRFRLLGEEP